MKKILITGVSGFIGSYLAKRILKDDKDVLVVGLDNMNDYYDTSLKEYRLNLEDDSTFPFAEDAFIMAQKILGNPFKELVNTFSENNNWLWQIKNILIHPMWRN